MAASASVASVLKAVRTRVSQVGGTSLLVKGDSKWAQIQAAKFRVDLARADIHRVIEVQVYGHYPTATAIDDALLLSRRVGVTSVLAVGSGAVVDTAKAISLLQDSGASCSEWLANSNSTKKDQSIAKLYTYLKPSSVGSGAFANKQCLVWDDDREALMPLPVPGKVSEPDGEQEYYLDGSMLSDLSARQLTAMALTALVPLLDGFIVGPAPGQQHHDRVREHCASGVTLIGRALHRALVDPGDLLARSELLQASAHAGAAAGHVFEGPCQTVVRAAASCMLGVLYSEVGAVVLKTLLPTLPGVLRSGNGQRAARRPGGSAADGQAAEGLLAFSRCLAGSDAGPEGAAQWTRSFWQHLPAGMLGDLEPNFEVAQLLAKFGLLSGLQAGSHSGVQFSREYLLKAFG